MMYRLWVAVFAIVTLLQISCTVDRVAGNGSQTGNPMIAGILYTADGTTPACEAYVYVRTRKTTAYPGAAMHPDSDTAAMTRTACDGTFTIDSIDTGLYVVEGSDGGNNLAFFDSVAVYFHDSTLRLPPAALKPAGAIRGAIRLTEGGDPRKVFVIIPALDRFTTADSGGTYAFELLAEGYYAIKILPTLDNYGVFDTVNIPVISADTTALGVIGLPFTGLPTVSGLAISYDTLLQRVTLTWGRPGTALVKSFNVYRRELEPVSAVIAQVNFFPVADTLFIDSFCEQNKKYEYHIAAVDAHTNEGTRSAGATALIALYELSPENPVMVYDTTRQTVTLRWSNPDSALVTGYNVYRRNVRRNETFWTPYNNGLIRDTFFIDSSFKLSPTDDGSCDDSLNQNTPAYEYCVAALIRDLREGVRSAGIPLRISTTNLTPTGLNFTYDTLQQQVRLRWNRPDMTIVHGFVVFRRSVDDHETAFSQISNISANDTFYLDSTGAQNQTYEYCIASVVKNGRAVVKSAGVSVRITASFIEDSVFTICGSGPEQINFPNDIAVAANGNVYIVDQGNSRIQVFDSTMRFKMPMGVGILDYPLKVGVDEQGKVFVSNYDSDRDCSSLYLFDSTGAVTDTILDSTILNDIDVNNGLLYAVTDGRYVTINSCGGGILRSWQVNRPDAKWIVAGDLNSILVGVGLQLPDKIKVVAYDSLGNGISSTTLPYFAGAAAFDEPTKSLYAVGADGRGACMLHVMDLSGIEKARYKIKSDDQNISIGIQTSGAVFIVLKNEGKIIKLKPSR